MRAVMVATVKGPDTGASVVASILHSMPSYHFQGFVPGNGWVHLDEFAQRWLTLREKMTNPANPDYIHFSQFVATPDDGIAPDIEDSDFRTEAELFRRKVKPAWIQYFNTSKVMCAIRRLYGANAPPPGHAGFTKCLRMMVSKTTQSLRLHLTDVTRRLAPCARSIYSSGSSRAVGSLCICQ